MDARPGQSPLLGFKSLTDRLVAVSLPGIGGNVPTFLLGTDGHVPTTHQSRTGRRKTRHSDASASPPRRRSMSSPVSFGRKRLASALAAVGALALLAGCGSGDGSATG